MAADREVKLNYRLTVVHVHVHVDTWAIPLLTGPHSWQLVYSILSKAHLLAILIMGVTITADHVPLECALALKDVDAICLVCGIAKEVFILLV